MRVLTVVTSVLVTASCVAQPDVPSANPNWRRVSGVEAGCVAYSSREREPVDRNVIPTTDFASRLLAQLDPADRAGTLCWYETPEGRIRLFAGGWCIGGTQSEFEERSEGWRLVNSSLVSIICKELPPNTSLERTRDK
jgi:hypothetical protein